MSFEESFLRVYSLPYNNNVHEITPDSDAKYGFAWITSDAIIAERGWICETGSFEYLYGIYRGLAGYFEMIEQLSPEGEEEPTTFTGGFFVLDADLQPIEVITSIGLSPQMHARMGGYDSTHGVILRDLSLIFDEDVPVLEFKI